MKRRGARLPYRWRPERAGPAWQRPARTRRNPADHAPGRPIPGVALLAFGTALVSGFVRDGPVALGGPPLTGAVEHVVDGDTFDLGGTRIRLAGIDAPERDQSCGRADGTDWACGGAAAARLRALLRGREVACAATDFDRYGRTVAACRSGGADLGELMVHEGLAVALGPYQAAEADARAQHLGIWQGEFMRPADWRRRSDPAEPPQASPGDGNPSRFDRFVAWLERLLLPWELCT